MFVRLWLWRHTCRCGHDVEVHTHFRDGGRPTDCGTCGRELCSQFRRGPFPRPSVLVWRQ